MAKFRTNHRQKEKSGSGMIAKVGIFSLILGVLYFAFDKFLGTNLANPIEEGIEESISEIEQHSQTDIYYLPTSTTNQVVSHQFYTLSYSEAHEQAEWVAYELTRELLKKEWVDRTNNFRPDPRVKTGSATSADYKRSGYDRGHLVPAADMAFSKEAMSQTFYMSNISPQLHGFNAGIWRELEELTRDWAKRFKHLYVVTGPILTPPIKFWLGDNQVAVPHSYYKVLLDLSDPELKGIAYIIPNEVREEPIETFATSIDQVEAITGIDFFPELMDLELEEKLEKEYDASLWRTNDKKYQLRVKSWNKR